LRLHPNKEYTLLTFPSHANSPPRPAARPSAATQINPLAKLALDWIEGREERQEDATATTLGSAILASLRET
jgi:hypothetical protein